VIGIDRHPGSARLTAEALALMAILKLSKPDHCKILLRKCRNTSLFMDKTSMKPMFLDLTSNEL
jgi:hypothetical protein